MSGRVETHESDVLVVGGGLAGCMAAASAAERGAKVSLTTKASLTAGGNGSGVIQIATFPPFEFEVINPTGERRRWGVDDTKKYLDSIRKFTEGLLNEKMTQLFIDRSWDMVKKLEAYGLEMTSKETGNQYQWAITMGSPRIRFGDANKLQLRLSEWVLKHKNITPFERTMTVDCLVKDGRVIGAIGFNVRSGTVVVHYARTTILATGACFRVYENPSGIPYNARHSPFNTGDGQAMTLRSGGDLVSMEIPLWSTCPQHYVVCATSGTSTVGGTWLNALGEKIIEKHFGKQFGAPPQRFQVAGMVREEILKGNGPVFLDMTHVPKQYATYGFEPKVALAYLESRKIDPSRTPMEVTYHADEALSGQLGGGIRVNTRMETTLENLYAAGEVANGGLVHNGQASQSMVQGMVAGENAADKSKHTLLDKIDESQLEEYRQSVVKPLSRKEGMREEAVEHNLRRVMTTYVQYERNERGLLMALERVSGMKDLLEQVKAASPHQLMRFFELRNMLDCSEGIVRSALFRNESRAKPLHHRTDFPERDDANWLHKITCVRTENGEMKMRKMPIGG